MASGKTPSALEVALARFREFEAPERGPRFAAVCSAIEELWAREPVFRKQLLGWIGVPDLFGHTETGALYVYRFDHHQSRLRRDEWFFAFHAEQLHSSGFNRAGINSLTGLRPSEDFVDPSP